jgi:replication factor C subunit 2/4
MICLQEGVQLAPNTMQTLIQCSGGDLRKAITFLQSGYNLKETVTPRMVHEMAGRIPDELIDDCRELWASQDVNEIEKVVKRIMMDGYSAENLLSQLHEKMIVDDSLSTLQKSNISQIMSTVDIDLIQGGDEHLQMLNLMMQIASIVAY